MRIEYNPRTFLLLVPLPMLRQYFDGRGVLGDTAWDDLTEKDYETVYAAWQALPPRARDTVGADFLDVAGLATKQGIQVIIEEGKFHNKDLVAELAALPSHTEKTFYTLLQYPRVFRVARQLNYADNLTRYWHRRHDLPKKPPNISAEARLALRKAMSDYYMENQGRGQYHDLDLRRHGSVHYFMVYLSDYPDTFAGFDNEGKIERQPQTPAFDVVFRYDESRGHLDLYAEGPRQLRRDLEQIFAQTALAEDLSLQSPPGVAFHLDHLKDPSFSFLSEPADGIFSVTLRSMQLSVPEKSTGRVTFELLPYSDGGNIHQLIENALNQNNWRLEDLCVDQVKMKVTFVHGKPRAKTVTLSTARILMLLTCGDTGDYRLLGERTPELLLTAQSRGNLYVTVTLGTHPAPMMYLAMDDPESAMRILRESTTAWRQDTVTLQEVLSLVSGPQVYFYRGESAGASEMLGNPFKRIVSSLQASGHMSNSWLHVVRGRWVLAEAAAGRDARSLGHALKGHIAVLKRQERRWTDGMVLQFQAGQAYLSGSKDRAATLLRDSIAKLDGAEMEAQAAALRYLLAQWIGGDEGDALRSSAIAWAMREQIHNPHALFRMHAPGLIE